MKNVTLSLAISLAALGTSAESIFSEKQQYIAGFGCTDCFNFVAPSVFDVQTVGQADVGQIAYDTNDNQFKGYKSDGTWTSLSSSFNGNAGGTSVTLESSDARILRFNPTSAEMTVTLGDSYVAGTMLTIKNVGTERIKVQSDTGADDIAPVYPGQSLQFLANAGSPSTASDWDTIGTIQSNVESFTPTGSLTSNVIYSGKRWRIGQRMHYSVLIEFTGSNSQGGVLVDIPDGDVDLAQLNDSSGNDTDSFGTVIYFDGGFSRLKGDVTAAGTTRVRLKIQDNDSSSSNYIQDINTSTNFPLSEAAGHKIHAHFSVPIVGWTSNSGI